MLPFGTGNSSGALKVALLPLPVRIAGNTGLSREIADFPARINFAVKYFLSAT